MPEHELLITALFNNYLAGLGNAVLSLVGVIPENPEKPWANFVTLQIAVFLFLVILFAALRPRLSMDKPGKLQHFFEVIYKFLHDQAEEIVGHDGPKYLHMFSSIFLFVLFANLIGVLPFFESPTMFPPVPLGCALVAFCYYHVVGVRAQGLGPYIRHFGGPVWWLAPLMFPIEIVSHLGRLLSLTVRLYANMLSSEMVFVIFVGMVPLAIPAIFLGEHIFKAILQGYIFVLLTMVYVQGAVAEEH